MKPFPILMACFALVGITAAQQLIVPTLAGQDLLLVDQGGGHTIFASMTRPFLTKFDASGDLFAYDSTTDDILRFPAGGGAPTVYANAPGGGNDITITDDGTVYRLQPTQICEIPMGGSPILVADITTLFPGQSGRGFTCGPGGDLYVAMQAGPGAILRVTRAGAMSIEYQSPISGDFIDVRFDSAGDIFVLGNFGGGKPILKISGGVESVFVPGGVLDNGSIQMTIDASDNLYVISHNNVVEKITPGGAVATICLVSTPGAFPLDIDDTEFDSCSAMPICSLCGDCNENMTGPDATDALAAAQISAGLFLPTATQMLCCDVDSNALITVLDALAIARSAVGLPISLVCP